MFESFLMLAIAVLPADRMAMADRLFNNGKYVDAAAEYKALVGEKSIAEDEILFRLAECDRQNGKNDEAIRRYQEIFEKHPDSKHAVRARFLHAMGFQGAERHKLLVALDSDRVDVETRAAALYYLGSEMSDRETLVKCVKLAPKGTYAGYANLKYATLLNASSDPVERRKGVEVMLGLAFGKGPMAEEALYLAAIQSFRDKKYGEAGSLFLRYRKNYPNGANIADARSMSAWSDFMEGRYVDAAATCGEGNSDDLAYLRAACAYSLGDNGKALTLFRKYLEEYPKGRYRADAELPIARIEFDEAQKTNDVVRAVESARRGFGLSKLASDQLRLAWAYENADKPEDAQEEYMRIAEKFPGTEEAAEAMFRKALIDARREKWSASEMSLAEALTSGKLGKRKGEALYWRGVAAMKLGYEAEGAAYLEQAIEAGISLDETREARLMIADCDYRGGRIDRAKKAYAELVKDGACDRMSASRILTVGKLIGGAEAEICALSLTKSSSSEWRQAGWELKGECEEARSAFSAAVESYRKSLAEPVKTESAAASALRLGRLEFRAGEHDHAEQSLKQAIALNSDNAQVRAEAYILLAKNAGARGDWETAIAYATVVTSLFDDPELCAEAKKIIDSHQEKKE